MIKATKRITPQRATIKTLPRLQLSSEARDLIREQNRVHRMWDAWRIFRGRGKAGKLAEQRLREEYDQAHAAYRDRCTALAERKRGLPMDRDELATLAAIAYDQGDKNGEAKLRLFIAVLHAAGVTTNRRTKWRLRASRN